MRKRLSFICAVSVALAPVALADVTLDLTTAGASGWVNDAFFQQIDPQPTGTGVIDPFVRIQANKNEEGYNTDARPVEFDEKGDLQYTHALLLTDVPVVNLGGIDYRQFLLDINEPNGRKSTLSLNEIEIFMSDDNMINSKATLDALGAIYDLDAGAGGDATIEMDYDLNPGSGGGDMFAYIPSALFVGGDFVYLYSAFGNAETSGDGFEEWAVIGAGNVIPAPGAATLGVLGISMLILRRRND